MNCKSNELIFWRCFRGALAIVQRLSFLLPLICCVASTQANTPGLLWKARAPLGYPDALCCIRIATVHLIRCFGIEHFSIDRIDRFFQLMYVCPWHLLMSVFLGCHLWSNLLQFFTYPCSHKHRPASSKHCLRRQFWFSRSKNIQALSVVMKRTFAMALLYPMHLKVLITSSYVTCSMNTYFCSFVLVYLFLCGKRSY